MKSLFVQRIGYPSKEAFLFLHGFPDDPGNKNIDFAKRLCADTGLGALLPHYKGLGQSQGQFSFYDSVADCVCFVKDLIGKNKIQKLHVVGHSWGGLVALAIAKELPGAIASMILLSPLNAFPSAKDMDALLNEILNDPEGPDFSYATHQQFLDQLLKVKAEFNPRKMLNHLLRALNFKISIFQAAHDTELPTHQAKEFYKLLPQELSFYQELDTDHSFWDHRDENINLVTKHFLENHLK